MHQILLVPTPPLIFYYLIWISEHELRQLIFSVAQSKLAVCAVVQFLRVASSGATHAFRTDDRVSPGKPLLVAVPSALIGLVDLMGIRLVAYDFNYSCEAPTMA